MGRVERAARKVWAKESSVMVSERKLDVLRDRYQSPILSACAYTRIRGNTGT